jgi:hypothetical protein
VLLGAAILQFAIAAYRGELLQSDIDTLLVLLGVFLFIFVLNIIVIVWRKFHGNTSHKTGKGDTINKRNQ